MGAVGTEERLGVACGFCTGGFPDPSLPSLCLTHSLSSVVPGWATPGPPRTHTWSGSGLSQMAAGSIPQVSKTATLTFGPTSPTGASGLWASGAPACPQAPPPSPPRRRWPRPRATRRPRPAHALPPARRARAAPSRLAGDRKVVLCAPAAAGVPASSGGTCGYADVSRRGPGARSGPSSLTLTPARLPLRAQPAGGRARRGPGRGDVSADARVSGAGRPRAFPPSPSTPTPAPTPPLPSPWPLRAGRAFRGNCCVPGRPRQGARAKPGGSWGPLAPLPRPAGPRSRGGRVSWDLGQALHDVILSPA